MAARNDGFGPDVARFFDELAENNSRDFFSANRDRFDREVAEPMAALLDSLPETYHPFKTFRMNRDVRFSKDKSPYKTQHSAISGSNGVDFYLHVDAHGFLAATGAYMFAPAQLDRFRSSAAAPKTGARLETIVGDLRGKRSLNIDSGGATPLKTAPRGYPKDHPRIELLRRKGLIGSRTLTATDLRHQTKLRRFVVDTFEMCEDLNDWIAGHVGADLGDQAQPARGGDPGGGVQSTRWRR